MLTFIGFWLASANRSDVLRTSREGRHRHHAPFSVVAVAFVMALGALAICLFWPSLLPLVVAPREATAAPCAALFFMVLGAGALVFPLLLLFTAINYTTSCRKPRPCEVIDALAKVKDESHPLLSFRRPCAASRLIRKAPIPETRSATPRKIDCGAWLISTPRVACELIDFRNA
ncbi:hypothetical protein V1281_005416 [Nitrobacteraceae bacterium AZCC 2161]